MDDVEETKKEALESVPHISDVQVPTKDETSEKLLYGNKDRKSQRK